MKWLMKSNQLLWYANNKNKNKQYECMRDKDVWVTFYDEKIKRGKGLKNGHFYVTNDKKQKGRQVAAFCGETFRAIQ